MVRLEHLNLVVRDIERSLSFYKAAFPHWEVRGGGDGEWSGKPRQWVHFGDNYNYLCLNNNGDSDPRDLAGHQVGLAHLGFSVEDLDGLIGRLREAGFEVDHPGAPTEYRRNVYFVDPDGIEVEFVEYRSDIPGQRNDYSEA
ncbi:VOC family protein [Parasalinivibrio latis]|uniref:VOC family protein n=1 Tax=Parasalinivibrio latis TaxID=2952610 RepID=UPI0030E412AB